jgi:thymidylate synthase
MMAQVVGLKPGEFVHTLGDAHLYLNHCNQAEQQTAREPLPPPRLKLAPKMNIFEFGAGDIKFEGYEAHPMIKAPIAV